MFVFFIALMIQALIEREIRNKMKDHRLDSLQIYPESRNSAHPTTSKVSDVFSDVSTYTISRGEDAIEEYSDELSSIQKTILELLNISVDQYWHGIPSQSENLGFAQG